jgi:hypothetical protein
MAIKKAGGNMDYINNDLELQKENAETETVFMDILSGNYSGESKLVGQVFEVSVNGENAVTLFMSRN